MIPGVVAYPRPKTPTHIGRYKILGRLGGGVFRAQDPAGRTVAIKTGNPDDSADRQWQRERILREAAHLQRLSHPNIIKFYGLEEEDGQAHLVMECVDGLPLEEILTGGNASIEQVGNVIMLRPADPKRKCWLNPDVTSRHVRDNALSILRQTAAALDHMHAIGIVHRDIKPLNILVTAKTHVTVIDFERSTSPAIPSPLVGRLCTTPAFMSPEQVQEFTLAFGMPIYVKNYWPREDPLDGRSDLYSLATVAYRMLTGKFPFRFPALCSASDLLRLFERIFDDPPEPANQLNPTLRPAAGTVLTKALAKYPEDRYRTCGEFVEALAAAL